MTEMLFWIFLIIAAVFAYRLIRGLGKRVFLMVKLSELKKENGAEIKYNTLPFFSLIKLSKKPEIAVSIGNTVYLVRLMGAKSRVHRVHFANEEYTVTVRGKLPGGGSKIMIQRGAGGVRPNVGGAKFVPVSRDYFAQKCGKVRLLPKLEAPDKSLYKGKTLVPVLIFNPAPFEVTYVTEEKNRVLAAFTGDSVYGQMIFTASSFVRYADRRARQEAEASEAKEDEFAYFPS